MLSVEVKTSTAHLLSAIWSRHHAYTCSTVSDLNWSCERFGHPSAACRSSREGAGRRGSDFWRCWYWYCFPADVAAPYAPLLELLRFLFEQYPWTRSFALTPQVVEAFQPWFSHLFPGNTTPPVSPSSSRSQAPIEKRQLFERLASMLSALSEHQPLLACFYPACSFLAGDNYARVAIAPSRPIVV